MILRYPDFYMWLVMPDFTPSNDQLFFQDLQRPPQFFITPQSMVDMKAIAPDNLSVLALGTGCQRQFFTPWV